MTRENIRVFLAALPFVGAVACAGDATNTPPQTPSDQTTTTAATPVTAAPVSTPVGQAGSANDDSNATSNLGTDSNPSGLRSPIETTAGTSPAAGAGGATGGLGPATSGDAQPLNDGEVVAIVQAADRGEIDQTREALRKAQSGGVKQFAQHMATDHAAAEARLSSLENTTGIMPQENAVTARLKAGGEQILGNLRSASGSDFDKLYIDAQVSEYAQVLELLDNRLIPQAQNIDLTKTLRAVRAKVAGHLKLAQDIQTKLAQTN